MVPKNIKEIPINLKNIEIISNKTQAFMLIAIIEFLSFQRNQIPFVYETYKYMVNKIRKNDKICVEEDWNNQMLEMKRNSAIETLDSLAEISKNILIEFSRNEITEAMILFGGTIFAPKEAFTVKLPEITKNHFHDNHSDSTSVIVKKMIMSLITSESFNEITSTQIHPTNMFVLLKKKSTGTDLEFFQAKDYKGVSLKCKTIFLNILPEFNSELDLNCCKEISIFQDMTNLNLNKKEDSKNENPVKSIETSWFESKVIVKGFKDVLVKGKRIWLN